MSKAREAVRLVAQGKSYSEAAKAVGLDWSNVKVACLRRGVYQSAKAEARSMNKSTNAGGKFRARRSETAALVCRMVASGMTYGEVANQLNISRERVAGYVYRSRKASA